MLTEHLDTVLRWTVMINGHIKRNTKGYEQLEVWSWDLEALQCLKEAFSCGSVIKGFGSTSAGRMRKHCWRVECAQARQLIHYISTSKGRVTERLREQIEQLSEKKRSLV